MEVRSQVAARLTCVQRNYHVLDEAKRGFFRDDLRIEKTEMTLRDQLNPYIYQLRDDSEEESDEGHSMQDLLGKRRRVAATSLPRGQHPKLKRVTLSRNDLDRAIIQLFQEKPEYKLGELQQRLNHPSGSLKNALKSLCDFDPTKKVFTFKSNL